MKEKDRYSEFDLLKKFALDKGAEEAVLIPSSEIFLEERINLKCRTGCPSYGNSLSCPPYAPDIRTFRRMVEEYQNVLLIRFRSQVRTDPGIIHSLMKNRYDPKTPCEIKERTSQFNSRFADESRKIHFIMLDLEKLAFNAGYPFALAFTVDSCDLCKKCNVKGGICMHPSRMRYCLEAVGINVVKTAMKAGIQIEFPCRIPPDRITILLIS